MTKALFKETLRTIKRTMARFVALIAIIALGVAFFVGTNATPGNMLKTAEDYFHATNLMDISVISTAGLTDSDIYSIMTRYNKQIEAFMPVKFVDGLLYMDGKGLVDIDGSAFTCRAISMDFTSDDFKEFMAKNPDFPNYKDGVVPYSDVSYINRLTLLEGRFPEKPGECVVDSSALSTPDEFAIGKVIELKGDKEDLSQSISETKFEIVGIIRTPTYINFERGNTTIGSGKLGTFIYAPQEIFTKNYYSQLFLKLRNATPTDYPENNPYNEDYTKYVESVNAKIEELSHERLEIRRTVLRNELTEKLSSSGELLEEKEQEMEKALEDAQKQLEDVQYYALNGDAVIAEKKAEFENTFNEKQKEWYAGQEEYNKNAEAYNDAALELAEAIKIRDENPNYKKEYEDAKYDLDNTLQRIQDADSQIKRMEQVLTTLNSFFETMSTNSPWESIMGSLTEVGLDTELINKMKSATVLGMFEDAITVAEPSIEDYTKELTEQKQALNSAKLEYVVKYAEWLSKKEQVDQLDNLTELEKKLNDEKEKLDASKIDLNMGEAQLSQSQTQAQMELLLAQQQVAKAKEAYPTAKQTFNNAKTEAEAKLADAKRDIENAQNTLDNLDKTRWIVEGREDLPGNLSYEQNAENVRILGTIFPIVFFAVAALVVLTTIARMIEEERMQMGTLKALGYEETAIAWKYIFYALLAGGIGTIIGYAIGFSTIPWAVFAAFGIMFDMPSIHLSFHWGFAGIGLLIALLCSVGAAFIACHREMSFSPAQLMRPKAPKAGKRVLMERIPMLWNSLNFTGKVTVRNLLRNKRRFITTFIGITGTTALLLASFGLGDSVGAIINYQYGENGISQQDVQMVLQDPIDISKPNEGIWARLKADSRLSTVMPVAMKVLTAGSEKSLDQPLQEVNVLVPAEQNRIGEIASLRNRTSGERLYLDDYGVIVTEMFAERANVSAGDTIFIHNADGTDVSVRVRGVSENYTFSYIYMTQTVYESLFLERPEFNMIFAQLSDDIRNMDTKAQNDAKATLSTDCMKINGVNAVVYTTQIVDSFANIVKSLNYVILVFILAAAALAFVVLFNLSNININERLREIATIKVLGFYDGEVSAYIYRENIILTLLGMAGGVVGGIFLHKILAEIVRINVVMLGQTLEWRSYLYALLITAGFTVLVSLIMHRKLKTISMVESLKSVE